MAIHSSNFSNFIVQPTKLSGVLIKVFFVLGMILSVHAIIKFLFLLNIFSNTTSPLFTAATKVKEVE